jgi:DNA-binding Lrp family transcriptional regulator|tara:strand:+ start:7332 stop:7916 length:585 start_codon:yes stop_codon:yes gene_type:complete
MHIRVKKKENYYAQVHKNLLFNPNLAIQAKGLGAILECYSDDFKISFESLKIHTQMTDKTLRKYVRQLEENQFLFRIQIIKNCELIWFFDSQNLDIIFLIDEIKKIQSVDKIRYLTAYQFLAGENFPREKFATYNNTTKENQNFSDMNALQIMYEIANKKGKKENLPSDYYTNSQGKVVKRKFINTPKNKEIVF